MPRVLARGIMAERSGPCQPADSYEYWDRRLPRDAANAVDSGGPACMYETATR